MKRAQKILLTLLSGLMLACGPKAPTDQSLAADIQAKLAANDATRAANVKVTVTNGVVILGGDVPTSDAALQAMTVANNMPGIKSVSNQMRIQDISSMSAAVPPPGMAPLPASMTPTAEPPPAAPPQPVASVPPPGVAAPMPQPARMPPPPIAPEPTRPPAPPPTVTIPAGERLSVRMIDGIDTGHNQEGETFKASLSAPITHGDHVIVPAGAGATVLLASAKGAGRIKGSSELELRLTSIVYRGERVPVESGVYEAKGNARGKQTAIRTGIGAAAGALIGGLAGGGKGAGIGAAAGGGAGVGLQLFTHGKQIKIPSETEIGFNLAAPLVLTLHR